MKLTEDHKRNEAKKNYSRKVKQVTVLEVIQRTAPYLGERGVESPRLQIELMLAHVLQMPRLKLYLEFNRNVSEAELETLRAMVKRRGQREPLQHILGTTSFCGHEIAVNRHVLVPRPETEVVAEKAWKYLCSFTGEPKVLDLGTGSGCLAIAIAKNCPKALIHATDISEEALAVARQNTKIHGLTERISLFLGDGFNAVPPAARYDLIVTNPPYIASNVIPKLEPEVRDHDPRAALDGGPDGLAVIRRIAADGPTFMKPASTLMLEFGDEQAAAMQKIFSALPWQVQSIEKDFSARERFLIARCHLS